MILPNVFPNELLLDLQLAEGSIMLLFQKINKKCCLESFYFLIKLTFFKAKQVYRDGLIKDEVHVNQILDLILWEFGRDRLEMRRLAKHDSPFLMELFGVKETHILVQEIISLSARTQPMGFQLFINFDTTPRVEIMSEVLADVILANGVE